MRNLLTQTFASKPGRSLSCIGKYFMERHANLKATQTDHHLVLWAVTRWAKSLCTQNTAHLTKQHVIVGTGVGHSEQQVPADNDRQAEAPARGCTHLPAV